MVEHRHELEGLACAQVLEVVVRDQFAGQIALAFHAQDFVLQVNEAAAFQTQLP
ncbi:hypothetical protein D3C83_280030 [compost metagenome]